MGLIFFPPPTITTTQGHFMSHNIQISNLIPSQDPPASMDSIIPPREEASAVDSPDFADELQRSFEKIALARTKSTDSSKEANEWVEASLTRLQCRFEKRKQIEDDQTNFSAVWTCDTVLEMHKLYRFLTETRDARGDDAWSEEEHSKKQQLALAVVDRMQLDYLYKHVTDLQVLLCTIDEKDVGSYCVRTLEETCSLLQFYVDILVCLDISKETDGLYDLDAHSYDRETPTSLKFLSQLCKKATNTLRLFLWDVVQERGNSFWTREDKGTLKGLFLEVLDLGRVVNVPGNEEDYEGTSVEEDSSEEERGRSKKRGRREIRGRRNERGRREQRPKKAKEREEYDKEKEEEEDEEIGSVEEEDATT